MNSLNEIALEALKRGSDYYGEKIIGVKDRVLFYEKQECYAKTVLLENHDGSPCSSEVGFYLKNSDQQEHTGIMAEQMIVISGKKVFSGIFVTPIIKKELENAERIAL